MITHQLSIDEFALARLTDGEIDVDDMCGMGGFSEGFRQATGRSPHVVRNHDRHAIAVHKLNHPEALHLLDDIRRQHPAILFAGCRIRWYHGSPDCTHHSKAKGGKPRSQKMRGLAWHMLPVIFYGGARYLSMENVGEFMDWGPLDPHGQPIKAREGETFRAFIACLTTGLAEDDPSWPEIRSEIGDRMPMEALSRGLGLRIDHREMVACDLGSPTIRKRWILIGRRDHKPIIWPASTHGPGRRRRHRTAAECIDWSDLGRSIFGRKKPLADATLRRIAAGANRYVISSADPYIVTCNHGKPGFRGQGIHEPMKTITASRDAHALVAPVLTKAHSHGWDRNGGPSRPANRPAPTIVTKPGDALFAGILVQTGYGERDGQAPRALDLRKPLGTVMATGGKHAVAGCVIKNYTDVVGSDLRDPLATITTRDHNSLMAAHLAPFYSRSKGADLRDPMPTITAQSSGGHQALCSYAMAYYGTERDGQSLEEPLRTIPTKARFGLCTLANGQDMAGALRVGRFLLRYAPETPLSWIHVGNRLRPIALVTVDGNRLALTDLLFRMLKPVPELLVAQGFRRTYRCPGTKEQQTERIGNSVPPQFAKAIVRANLAEELAGVC